MLINEQFERWYNLNIKQYVDTADRLNVETILTILEPEQLLHVIKNIHYCTRFKRYAPTTIYFNNENGKIKIIFKKLAGEYDLTSPGLKYELKEL